MSLQFIIDAYNILNHPSFKAVEKSVSGVQKSLLDFIQAHKLTGSAKNKIILVFDGYPPAGEEFSVTGDVLFIFSRKISADEKIAKLIEESANPRDIMVISDDRQVQLMARSLKARVCAVSAFGADKKIPPGRSQDTDDKKVSFSAMEKINSELRKRWLGKALNR